MTNLTSEISEKEAFKSVGGESWAKSHMKICRRPDLDKDISNTRLDQSDFHVP